MDAMEYKELQEAIQAADDALYHLQKARKCLNSAGNWGMLDIFGANLISGIVKHDKMADAEREIEEAKYALQRFSKELRDVSGYSSIHINEFLTFADFFFDGFVADVIVQTKISKAKRECDDAIRRISGIRQELVERMS